MKCSYVCHVIMLIIMGLITAGCGRGQNEPPASMPSLESADFSWQEQDRTVSLPPDLEKTTTNAGDYMTDVTSERILPVNLPQQLAYIPQLTGGSNNVFACDGTRFGVTDPIIYMSINYQIYVDGTGTIDKGQSLIICYANFSLGDMQEQIITPSGAVIRSSSFTVEAQDYFNKHITVVANDYTALPNDEPGTYIVTTQTPNGQFSTTFDVTNHLAALEDWAFVRLLGRGTNAASAIDAEYVFLGNFASRDVVNIYVYEGCKLLFADAEAEAQTLGSLPHYTFLSGFQVRVNEEGEAIIPLPPDISQAFETNPGNMIIVDGAMTEMGEMDVDFVNPETSKPHNYDRISLELYDASTSVYGLFRYAVPLC